MIDAHLHLGEDLIFDGVDTTEEKILEEMDRCGLEGAVIYPANSNVSLEAERERNERVAAFCRQYPERIYGICQLNPNYEREMYQAEVEKYKEKGLLGISVNPQVYGWDPRSHHGQIVFETAARLELPLFIAVGVGLPLGQPLRLYDLCQAYPQVPVVLVHADKSYCGHQCETLAGECANIYLETSLGPNMRLLKKYVDRYGADRVIMGSCTMTQVEHSIYMHEHCGITKEQKKWTMGKTIKKVPGIERGMEKC